MKKLLHAFFLMVFGLLSFGTGVCSALSSPAIFTSPAMVVVWLPSVAIAVGCFFAARYFYRRLTEKPEE